MERTTHTYNATVIYYDENNTPYCWEMVQVLDDLVYRSNGLWTYSNGTAAYHDDWLRGKASTLRIGGKDSQYKLFADNGKAYKDNLASMFG